MKLEYAVRIDRLAESDGGGYLATVPDLPGCMSDGETPEDVLKKCRQPLPRGSKLPVIGNRIFPKPSVPLARAG